MSKEKECPVCHKVGFHKMSCSTQKVTVFLSDEKIGNTDFVCDWCKRVLEVTKDNYFLGAKMYDDGVEENCTCNE